jgi:hypothetical protein
VNRIAPLAVLVLVTGLLSIYGRFTWSPLAGPVACIVVWVLARKADEPPAPVD